MSVQSGPHKVAIKTDIADANIPLLIHYVTLLVSNTITPHDAEMQFQTTSSSLYTLPITAPKELIDKFDNNNQHQSFLALFNCISDMEVPLKLHCSLAHLSIEKL